MSNSGPSELSLIASAVALMKKMSQSLIPRTLADFEILTDWTAFRGRTSVKLELIQGLLAYVTRRKSVLMQAVATF